MGFHIGTTVGHFYLDTWVMANVIQLSTQKFCQRFLNVKNDPCGRLFDQMTQAARSGQANIAEGAARRQTSKETEMKLTDVARVSLNELATDYLTFLLINGQSPWSKDSEEWIAVHNLRLETPAYSADLMHDVGVHILNQEKRFAAWAENMEPFIAANSLLILCGRLIRMLNKQISNQLEAFKQQGGFTENLTAVRLETIKQHAEAASDVPLCPKCGEKMIKRMAKKGHNAGNEFWSCMNYPKCMGTRSCKE